MQREGETLNETIRAFVLKNRTTDSALRFQLNLEAWDREKMLTRWPSFRQGYNIINA